jgi:formylglycine-generating enzyme required for sulfatase activity
VEPLSPIVPLAIHRIGCRQSTCQISLLLVLAAIAQLLLLLLQPVAAAMAADPCPASMTAIPGGSYRIGAGAQLPEEQPVRKLRISPFCLDRNEVSNDRFAAFVAATGYVTVAERPLSADQFPEGFGGVPARGRQLADRGAELVALGTRGRLAPSRGHRQRPNWAMPAPGGTGGL